MKLDTKLKYAQLYNTSDTVCVVASFPGRTNRSIREIDAIASYTDHFSQSFVKELDKRGKKLIILAQKINGKEEWYIERGILVVRVWDKGSPLAFAQILSTLRYFTQVKSMLIQFEFHQFGGNTTTALFPIFLLTLKAIGKTVSLVMHQVVTDISDLSGHVNIKKSSLMARFFTYALRVFYKSTTRFADTVTVHNAVLARRLEQLTGRQDISVIPHGLGAIHGFCSKIQARKKLGIPESQFVVLSFGFLTWYKGSDWIVGEFAKHDKREFRLVMAGGVSPNLKDKPFYQHFVQSIYKKAQNRKHITISGFVNDKDIALYFAASDLVVLPYRTLMSSSGPLAMTLAFKKPFIMSKALLPYTNDPDFSNACTKTGVIPENLSFPLQTQAFWQKIAWAKKNQKKLARMSTLLKASRTWDGVSERFADVVEEAGFSYQKKSAILKSPSLISYAPSHS